MWILHAVTKSLFVTILTFAFDSPTYAESQLALYAKNPGSWQKNAQGGAGVLNYDSDLNRFKFSANGLTPLAHYALIRHSNTISDVQIIAAGQADQEGSLSMTGHWSVWKGSFWLVLATDFNVKDGKMRLLAWRPELYLFEHRKL